MSLANGLKWDANSNPPSMVILVEGTLWGFRCVYNPITKSLFIGDDAEHIIRKDLTIEQAEEIINTLKLYSGKEGK